MGEITIIVNKGAANTVVEPSVTVATYEDMLALGFPVVGSIDVKVTEDFENAEGETTTYQLWAGGDITIAGQKIN